jgi:hypothetical protein
VDDFVSPAVLESALGDRLPAGLTAAGGLHGVLRCLRLERGGLGVR